MDEEEGETRQRSISDESSRTLISRSASSASLHLPKRSKPSCHSKRLFFVGLALLLSSSSILIMTFHPTLFFEVGETYMSCYAPRLSSFNSLFNIESVPCSRITNDHIIHIPDRPQTLSSGDEGIPILDPSWDHVYPSDPSTECNRLWNNLLSLKSLDMDERNKALKSISWRGNETWSNCFEWVVYANKCSKMLNILSTSVTKLNVPFKIIGMKTPWRGFGGRIRYFDQYLQHVPHHRILLFTDATDVIPVPTLSPPEMVYRFLTEFKTPTVFMAESECWPDKYLEKEYIQPPLDNSRTTPYIYLNAGSYMGYAWALRDLIKEAYTSDCSDDQRGFTRAYLLHASYTLDDQGQRASYLPRFSYISSAQSYKRIRASSDPVKSRAPLHHLTAINKMTIPLRSVQPNATNYISLDWYNIIFQSLVKTNMSIYDIKESADGTTLSLTNKITGGFPLVLHQNGDKTWRVVLQDLMEKFGYV